ncbi:Hypothetical protein ABZS17G119_03788 [Kosakonia cowanii]
MQEEVKPLVGFGNQRYFSPAPAKSGAGIGLLKPLLSTYDALCVFFMSRVRLRLNGGPGGGVARRAGVQ